jgi:aryl-alcohol dehydrogenase-like predicted oxidoreductase
MKRLGVGYIDLYQPGRANPHTPIEETIGAVAEMVKAGYVRHIGLSEIDAETLRRANAVHHISLIEM